MHTFFAENWVPVVLLTDFFLLYFCSFLSYYHDVKDGPEFFLFLYAKKKNNRERRLPCCVVLFEVCVCFRACTLTDVGKKLPSETHLVCFCDVCWGEGGHGCPEKGMNQGAFTQTLGGNFAWVPPLPLT